MVDLFVKIEDNYAVRDKIRFRNIMLTNLTY